MEGGADNDDDDEERDYDPDLMHRECHDDDDGDYDPAECEHC